MFEVIAEPEFEAWYSRLPEPLAEEVTTAIDLAASFSDALGPERLSRLLLWFDGSPRHRPPSLQLLRGRGVPAFSELSFERTRSYLVWHHEVLLCLESAAFTAQLQRLEQARAAQALTLVERLKRKLQAARLSGSFGAFRGYGGDLETERDPAGLKAAFLDLLRLMGLDARAMLGSGSGLRELCIDNVEPRLRVLFGLDFPGQRLIALLGEPLDRSYYGDSVKRAERRWQEYLQQAEQHAALGAP